MQLRKAFLHKQIRSKMVVRVTSIWGKLSISVKGIMTSMMVPVGDSTDTEDSDDPCDDDLVREALLRHEEIRLRMIAEKNRLIEEEEKVGEDEE